MTKRLFDIIASIVAVTLLALPLLVVALIVWLTMGKPILFVQMRPGLHGMPFKLLKFRTMRDAVDVEGRPLPDAERLTGLGRFLRSTSLDEFPELWNVLKGEMSLVGPRPLLVEYLALYTPEQMRRHEVRPGITGWAQVNGRNAVSWEERFRLDLSYVENRSFWLDLKILGLTLVTVFWRRGITSSGHATMPRFDQTLSHQK